MGSMESARGGWGAGRAISPLLYTEGCFWQILCSSRYSKTAAPSGVPAVAPADPVPAWGLSQLPPPLLWSFGPPANSSKFLLWLLSHGLVGPSTLLILAMNSLHGTTWYGLCSLDWTLESHLGAPNLWRTSMMFRNIQTPGNALGRSFLLYCQERSLKLCISLIT